MGVPTVSLSEDEAAGHFGSLAPWVGSTDIASSERTRDRLGWHPHEAGLVTDIDRGDYVASDRS